LNQSKSQDRVRPALRSLVAGGSALAFLLGFACASSAGAQEVSSSPRNTLEGQLVLALPAALQTGMSTGVGAAFTRVATRGGMLAWGASASWSTATEYSPCSPTYVVSNDDIRLRLLGQLQHAVGRGLFGLRVGAGGTLVYEARTLAQGARLGYSGASTSWAMLPAADIEGIVVLRIWNSWGMSVSGGPTLHGLHGRVRAGWSSGLGVTWQH
jgi:hypothetical protein